MGRFQFDGVAMGMVRLVVSSGRDGDGLVPLHHPHLAGRKTDGLSPNDRMALGTDLQGR